MRHQRQNVALRVQSLYRGQKAQRFVATRKQIWGKAAVKIQSWFRGQHIRRSMRKTVLLHRAALRIQRLYRGRRARLHVAPVKKRYHAAREIQRHVRGVQGMQRASDRRRALAATRIQVCFRSLMRIRKSRVWREKIGALRHTAARRIQLVFKICQLRRRQRFVKETTLTPLIDNKVRMENASLQHPFGSMQSPHVPRHQGIAKHNEHPCIGGIKNRHGKQSSSLPRLPQRKPRRQADRSQDRRRPARKQQACRQELHHYVHTHYHHHHYIEDLSEVQASLVSQESNAQTLRSPPQAGLLPAIPQSRSMTSLPAPGPQTPPHFPRGRDAMDDTLPQIQTHLQPKALPLEAEIEHIHKMKSLGGSGKNRAIKGADHDDDDFWPRLTSSTPSLPPITRSHA